MFHKNDKFSSINEKINSHIPDNLNFIEITSRIGSCHLITAEH